MKHAITKMLILPATLGCLSATPAKPELFWSYGPVRDDMDFPIHVRFLPLRFPNAYGFVHIVTPTMREVAVYEPSSMEKDDEGYLNFYHTVMGYGLNKGDRPQVRFGLSRVPYTPDMNYLDQYVRVMEDPIVEEGPKPIIFDDDAIMELDRHYYFYDPRVDAINRKVECDVISVRGLRHDVQLYDRKATLGRIGLRYENPCETLDLENVTAELRLLDHAEDFAPIAISRGGYSAIPLHVFDKNGAVHFELEKTVYYSQVDFMGSYETDHLPRFASKDFYLPLRNGHDSEWYSYQIALSNFGPAGDEVILRNRVMNNTNLFGPCKTATYCVVTGGTT